MTIISGAVAVLLVIVIGVSMLIQAGRVEEKILPEGILRESVVCKKN